jgi:hypothetical protein
MSTPDNLDLESTNGHNNDISSVPAGERLLLLPHCLRPSQGCPGQMTRQGLECGDCQDPDCKIRPLREAALRAGYKRVCIAPGGRLAVRAVAETRPEAIVAVACDKELAEGVAAVRALEWNGSSPPIYQIPLTHDGCVDTDVDVASALAVIET